MNVLVTSAGRRVKIIQYLKKELESHNGKVIAVDCDKNAPALYFAHHFELVPEIFKENYIKELKRICYKYQINGIISLIDPELLLLSKHVHEFKNIGANLILSDADVVAICFDKYKTYQFLKNNGLPYVPTYIDKVKVQKELEEGNIKFPLIVKPRKGSASIGIHEVKSLEEMNLLHDTYSNLIIQPKISGKEYGIDVYLDTLTNQPVDIFIKQKIKMRAGETDKSIAVRNDNIKELILKLVRQLKFSGPIDVDCFELDGKLMISEINPRFGGGYPHAYEAGVNFMRYITTNLKNKVNQQVLTNYQEKSIMIKYDSVLLMKP